MAERLNDCRGPVPAAEPRDDLTDGLLTGVVRRHKAISWERGSGVESIPLNPLNVTYVPHVDCVP